MVAHSCRVPRMNICFYLRLLTPPGHSFFLPALCIIISRYHPQFFLVADGARERSPPAVTQWNFIRSQGEIL